MKKTYMQGFAPLIIVLIIAAVAAIGGGVYYSSHKNHAPVQADGTAQSLAQKGMASQSVTSTTTAATSTATTTTAKPSGLATLRSFLGFSGSEKCDISATTKDGSTSGTVYISDSRMRGDFNSTIAGHAYSAHMLRNGDSVHVWTGSTGAVMLLSGLDALASSPLNKEHVSLDQQVSYTCKPWIAAESEFALPTGVSFIDVSALLKLYMKK